MESHTETLPGKDPSDRPQPGPGTFARQSSGLVRQVGALDTAVYNWIQTVLGFLIFTVVVWPLYPGASVELATVLAIFFSVAIGVTYALLSSAFPRSGGDFLVLSRILSPVVGFGITFLTVFLLAFYFGVNPALATIYGVEPMLSLLGLQTGSGALADIGEFFTTSAGIFLFGLAQIVLFTALLLRGAATFFRFLRWVGILAIFSVLVTLAVFVLGHAGALDFRAAYESLVGAGAYGDTVAASREAGTDLAPPFSLSQTLFFGVWIAFLIMFGQWSVSFAGEIKSVRRSQLWAMTGAMSLSGLMIIALVFFGKGALGTEFLRAAPDGVSDQLSGPYLNLFAGIAADNAVLTVIVNFWVLGTMGMAGGACAIYTSRLILAWGIDGLVPSQMTKVSDRYHSPTNAVLVSAALAIVSLTLFAFTDLVSILSGLLGFALILGLTALAGAIFPFVQRERFEASPAAIRVAGIPLITITGIAAVVFEAFLFYRALADDLLGANTEFSEIMLGSVVAVALVWFYAVRLLRRRQGRDLDAQFREIPVE